MRLKYGVCADIIRKNFNYGFDHTVNMTNKPGSFKALVERYNLLKLERNAYESRIHFTKPDDLSYSIVVFGDANSVPLLLDFLKNPIECESTPIDVEIHSVAAGRFEE